MISWLTSASIALVGGISGALLILLAGRLRRIKERRQKITAAFSEVQINKELGAHNARRAQYCLENKERISGVPRFFIKHPTKELENLLSSGWDIDSDDLKEINHTIVTLLHLDLKLRTAELLTPQDTRPYKDKQELLQIAETSLLFSNDDERKRDDLKTQLDKLETIFLTKAPNRNYLRKLKESRVNWPIYSTPSSPSTPTPQAAPR